MGQVSGIPTLNQQARANQQLARSISTLNTSVAAIAAQQAAQAAGRQAALGQVSTIPDGLGKGGLQVDNSLTQGWTNAKGPTQTQAGGKTTVNIEQTADKAILNWETFNVGRNTTVDFQQQSNWALLNRVNDPSARPSEIQGQINGAGTVMIMNRNGVVFSGTSQVNVRNLVAAAANITDEQFTQRGIYVDTNGTQPTFTDAAGKVEVQRGAVIQTHNAATSTDAGGYALLLGSEVDNAGTIITAKGQTTLAAGDSFYIRKGVGTAGNERSTTRGNEVAAGLNAGSTAGKVEQQRPDHGLHRRHHPDRPPGRSRTAWPWPVPRWIPAAPSTCSTRPLTPPAASPWAKAALPRSCWTPAPAPRSTASRPTA